MRGRLILFGALLLGAAAGCPFSFTNDDHCAAQAGDATCAAADSSAPYCAFDGCGLYDEVSNRTGCVAEQPTDMSCYSPCGGKQDANARSDCEAGTESSTTGSDTETTGPTSTTNPTVDETVGSETADSCGEGEWLLDGMCVACGDGPVCATDEPAEREACACDECMPAFEEGAFNVGCEFETPNCIDGECAAACRLPTECPAETGCEHGGGLCGVGQTGRAFYVRGEGGNDNDPGGEETPFETIGRAVAEAEVEQSDVTARPTTIFVDAGTYEEAIEVQDTRVIIRPWGDVTPELRSPDERPVLLVAGSGNGVNGYLNVVGLRFINSDGPVATVDGNGRFFGDGVEMRGNGAGIILNRGNGFVRNSIIAGTTGLVIEMRDQGDFGIVASTLVENGPAPWFDCSGVGSLRMAIRDSIIGNFDDALDFDDLSVACPLAGQGNTIRTVEGSLVVAEAFDDNYRLTANVDADAYAFVSTDFCDEEATPSIFEPCRPVQDIDGVDRQSKELGNWAGASLPPPLR